MRVITGQAKGLVLQSLPGTATRPTSQRMKEAMFSTIQFDIEGRRALDLFAGSGALGIEALSRGAAHCVFVDTAGEAVAVIARNLERAGLAERSEVVRRDATQYVQTAAGFFDLVFLDPPYASPLLTRVLPDIGRLVNPGGIVLCETDSTALPRQSGNLTLHRMYRHGRALLWKYYRSGEEDGL